MIVLTAYVCVQPAHLESALSACRTVRAMSVLEPGCERYDYFQSPDDATRIVFVEEWTTLADLHTHFEQAAFKEFVAAMAGFAVAEGEIRIFESNLVTA